MKAIIFSTLLITIAALSGCGHKTTLHDFTVEDIEGKPFDFSTLNGKKVLVVNVASKCGLTPQYAQLQQLYTEYSNRGFVIVGFPSNDFLEQEPGTGEEIAQFCELNYGVTFPLMSKVVVVGDSMAPVYSWLTQKSQNGVVDAPIEWNFQKFMIDEKGNLVDVIAPQAEFVEKITQWVTQ